MTDITGKSASFSLTDTYKGWLYKWTNYFRGYKKRWFILQNGTLSYYRNNSDNPQCCRGAIFISHAYIHTGESCNFVITNSSSRTYHLKASSLIEKQKWITALELSKSRHAATPESDDDDDAASDAVQMETLMKELIAKAETIKVHCEALQKSGSDLKVNLGDFDSKTTNTISSRINVISVATTSTIDACNDFLQSASQVGEKCNKIIQHERQQRQRLEDMVEHMGRQHSHLERKVKKSMDASMACSDADEMDSDDEYFDTVEDLAVKDDKKALRKFHKRSKSDYSTDNYNSSDTDSDINDNVLNIVLEKSMTKQMPLAPFSTSTLKKNMESKRQRRKTIPERPNFSIPLWGIMKNSIGKELSKIPMPVNFSEPLSFLQRLTEDFEYSSCLDLAATTADPFQRFALVAAFTVSSYASTSERTFKPFNPLLGETFECDRTDDLGWRSIAEQVSHHPPMVAMYTEGQGWIAWQEFTMSSKFRGTYLQIIPLGMAHLLLTATGDHYTWRKVTTTVHNIIVGRLWVDNHGEMDITNHKTGDVCVFKYSAYSYISKDSAKKVTGIIYDSKRKARYALDGTWDNQITGSVILEANETKGKTVFKTSDAQVLWKRNLPPSELVSRHNFSYFAVSLNEPEPGVAPTDSRLRPDQRLMEEGDWTRANEVKIELEEKQRSARRLMEQSSVEGTPIEAYKPKWFKKEYNPLTGGEFHTYTGEYWRCKEEKDWSRCPDIY